MVAVALSPVEELCREICSLWAPAPELMLDEWADAKRRLSKGESNDAGHWYTDRVPHTREIMRAYTDAADQRLYSMTDDPTAPRWIPWTRTNHRLVWMSSTQQAKTNVMLNITGYHMDVDPCQLIIMQPDISSVNKFSKKKLAPMLRDTPCLQGLIQDNKSRSSENTIDSKEFPGGGIAILHASSGTNLRMISGRVLLCDEFEAYTDDADGEGDAHALVLERLQTFPNWKEFIASTPLLKEGSRLEKAYLGGTQEEWFWPCPQCGGYQLVAFNDQLDYATLTYKCEYCHQPCPEHRWKGQQGIYVAGNPDAPYRSFHTAAMTSLLTSWETIVGKFRDAQEDLRRGSRKKYQTFVNCVLGHTYEELGDEVKSNFTRNRHAYGCEIPREVLLLTCAIDTQDNRIEVEVCGWGLGFERWGIQYLVIDGHPDGKDIRDQVDALLNRVWTRQDGAQLMITRLVWDSGGHYAEDVYDYCRRREGRGVYAVHGGTSWKDPLVGKASKVNRKGLETTLFTLGVNQGKDIVFDRLNTPDWGPGFCHWPDEVHMSDGVTPRGYGEEYFRQLQAEHRVTRYSQGHRHTVWEPKRKGMRNEAWDLMVYNLAAVMILGGAVYLEAAQAQDGQRAGQPANRLPQPPTRRRIISSGVH